MNNKDTSGPAFPTLVRKDDMKLDDLRVWHIPQVPGKPFHVVVATVGEAKLVLNALAEYDLFQFKHHIKPDYSNAQGLEMVEVGDDGELEWCEWCDDKTGADIHEYERTT